MSDEPPFTSIEPVGKVDPHDSCYRPLIGGLGRSAGRYGLIPEAAVMSGLGPSWVRA